MLCSLSMGFPILDISQTESLNVLTFCDRFLSFSTGFSRLVRVVARVGASFFFNCYKNFCDAGISRFVCPFISCWTFGWFPLWGCYDQCFSCSLLTPMQTLPEGTPYFIDGQVPHRLTLLPDDFGTGPTVQIPSPSGQVLSPSDTGLLG